MGGDEATVFAGGGIVAKVGGNVGGGSVVISAVVGGGSETGALTSTGAATMVVVAGGWAAGTTIGVGWFNGADPPGMVARSGLDVTTLVVDGVAAKPVVTVRDPAPPELVPGRTRDRSVVVVGRRAGRVVPAGMLDGRAGVLVALTPDVVGRTDGVAVVSTAIGAFHSTGSASDDSDVAPLAPSPASTLVITVTRTGTRAARRTGGDDDDGRVSAGRKRSGVAPGSLTRRATTATDAHPIVAATAVPASHVAASNGPFRTHRY